MMTKPCPVCRRHVRINKYQRSSWHRRGPGGYGKWCRGSCSGLRWKPRQAAKTVELT